MDNFKGRATRIDSIDISILSHRLDVGEDELHAFMEVEANGSGFDREGRPKMLFEPHVFWRNITDSGKRRQAEQAGLAYSQWRSGNYPSDSYPRLIEAIKIDEDAALKACSLGRSQVLVENFSSVGYESPQAMWGAFMEDEAEHVEAMVRFILVNGIADDLKAHRWETVARVYNGPGYRKHGYHTRLARAYRKWANIADTPWAPDDGVEGPGDLTEDELKAVQERLRDLHYVEVGMPDGKWGTKTRAGVLAYRADNDLPIYAGIDDQFLAALMRGEEREIGEARATATKADLRNMESTTIKATDRATAGTVVGVGTGLAVDVLDSLSLDTPGALTGFLQQIEPLIDTAKSIGPWAAAGIAAFVLYNIWQASQSRLRDHRSGKNAGPRE